MLAGLVAVLSIPSILKVLISTNKSSTSKTAYTRYFRTILHVFKWHSHKLKPGSKCWKSLEMVRKAHLKSSKLSTKRNAGIVSQKDLAFTQFGFVGFMLLDAEHLGIKDRKYYEGSVHLWRTIGYMLGISDEFNLCTDSWETTKPRLILVRDEIYKPALENTSPEFQQMTRAMISSMLSIIPTLTVDSFIFFTKRLAKCEGYEFFNRDFPNGKRIEGRKQHYENLSFIDKFSISYSLFFSDILYKCCFIRICMNIKTRIGFEILRIFPIISFLRFGFSVLFVKIFCFNRPIELKVEKE